MKDLMFSIAMKIASDRRECTLLVCASILKDALMDEGFGKKEANALAVDGMKIIYRTMLKIKTT